MDKVDEVLFNDGALLFDIPNDRELPLFVIPLFIEALPLPNGELPPPKLILLLPLALLLLPKPVEALFPNMVLVLLA